MLNDIINDRWPDPANIQAEVWNNNTAPNYGRLNVEQYQRAQIAANACVGMTNEQIKGLGIGGVAALQERIGILEAQLASASQQQAEVLQLAGKDNAELQTAKIRIKDLERQLPSQAGGQP